MPASAPARLAPSLLRPGPDMRLAPALAFALAPFAASAIIFNVNGSNADVLVGASNCKTLQLLANWDLQTQPFSSDSVRLLGVRNAASCTSNPPSPTAEITRNETVAQTGNDTISANQLALADGGTSGCDDPAIVGASSANPATNLLCLQWISGGTLTQASVNVKYALAKPTTPQRGRRPRLRHWRRVGVDRRGRHRARAASAAATRPPQRRGADRALRARRLCRAGGGPAAAALSHRLQDGPVRPEGGLGARPDGNAVSRRVRSARTAPLPARVRLGGRASLRIHSPRGDGGILAELREDDRARRDARQYPAGAISHHRQPAPIRA